LPGLRERTVMNLGLSKTFSYYRLRIGYAIAPPEISAAIRKVHDFLTVGRPPRCKKAPSRRSNSGQSITPSSRLEYQRRRDLFLPRSRKPASWPSVPRGAYYSQAEYQTSASRTTSIHFAT